MADLSTDLAGLHEAVSQLEDSTQRLSHQQATVSEELLRTADHLTGTETTGRASPGRARTGVAADD
jgi:hypothetical protein